MTSAPWLSLTIWIPILFGIAVLAFSDRHAAQVRRNCEPGDPFCRPRQRQALLQWAYDSRAI